MRNITSSLFNLNFAIENNANLICAKLICNKANKKMATVIQGNCSYKNIGSAG